SAVDAHRQGVRVLHQDLGLVDELSVVDNLALGHHYAGRYWVSTRAERRAAAALLAEYGVAVDPQRSVGSLSPTQKTMVAIVRALRDGRARDGVLVLDEPTASLPERETEQLFSLVQAVAARGGSVLYVTHRLHEVFRIADRATILRDGRHVATEEVSKLGHDRLIELIVGQRVEALYPELPRTDSSDVALEMRNLSGAGLHDVSLRVGRGEVVGVTGLAGSGLEHVLPLAFGALPRSGGDVLLAGQPLPAGSPRTSIARGLAFAPSDRHALSAIPAWTLAENITLPKIHTSPRVGWLSPRSERTESGRWLRALQVTPGDPAALFSALSGGNQQKAVIARWLRCQPNVLMVQEPTAGVDVGARARIYSTISQIAASGTGVLISSTDIGEVCGLCSRVLIVARGRLVDELTGDRVTEDGVLREVLRVRPTAAAAEPATDPPTDRGVPVHA
ncbi:MAG: Arabinose import ATP-binding protein AraG, partial [Pseudonocardiales bacterium]|nr:Arabinose import ATP-binding protein AraG [Pseudonocardiales bacterium]